MCKYGLRGSGRQYASVDCIKAPGGRAGLCVSVLAARTMNAQREFDEGFL